MPSTFVSSSWISRISYSKATNLISMTAKIGGTWDYPGDEEMYEEWAEADSKGEWFNENIKQAGIEPIARRPSKIRIKRRRKGR